MIADSKKKGSRKDAKARRKVMGQPGAQLLASGAVRLGPIPDLPSISQARKMFYDYLDRNRPWASCTNAYDMMEAIVNAAADAFRNDHRPTKEEMRYYENALLRFTKPLQEHPDDYYDGPCACAECRREGY